MNWRLGLVAVVAVVLLFGALQWHASRTATVVGFWYQDFLLTFDRASTSRLGGPLTKAEIEVASAPREIIERVGRAHAQPRQYGRTNNLSLLEDARYPAHDDLM